MRKVLIVILALAALLAGFFANIYWSEIVSYLKTWNVDQQEQAKGLQQARELLNNSKPEEALNLIQKYADHIDYRTDNGKEWLDLLIRASEALQNAPQLVILYEYYPQAFDRHEKAALLIGDTYLATDRGKDYQTLRDNWLGREASPDSWFILDADKLQLEGKRKEAIDFLNSRTLSGKPDTIRLIRLALLHVFDDPKEAWEYLNKAYVKDPENPDIRSYRAKLLETVGKNSQALTEYIAAVQTNPKDVFLKDQLAEFYLRNKQYAPAIQIWQEALTSNSLDFIWLKAIFWNRVVTPIDFNWKSTPIPNGKLRPLLDYLLTLKPGKFWDASSFKMVPDGQQFLNSQQTTFWLRVLSLLKEKKESEAYDLLQFNPFHTVSWNVQLENTLKSILIYRKTGNFSSSARMENQGEPVKNPKDMHVLFAELNYYSSHPLDEKSGQEIPTALNALLKGPDVFAAAFLAAGWNEAALQLNTQNSVPEAYPEWFSYELTQAVRANRGNAAALQFATLQKPTPHLSLLISELLIAENKQEAALDQLLTLAEEPTDVGYRAAWLASLIFIERGQYAEAKEIIATQPALAADVIGKETIARIALLEGNTNLADKIYESIEKTSTEAKSYLAHKAFANGSYERARELTENLLRQYPTNQLLKDNLKKINRALQSNEN